MRPEINHEDDDGDMEINRPYMRWATITLSEREIAVLFQMVSGVLDDGVDEIPEPLATDFLNLQQIFGELF